MRRGKGRERGGGRFWGVERRIGFVFKIMDDRGREGGREKIGREERGA